MPSTIGVHKAELKKAAQRQITQGVVTMDKQRRRSLKLLSGVCAATALPGLARAQRADATAEQISLIVPYGAGGSTDYIARLMAADLATRRSGSFIVENKAGAAGNIGTRYVAISAPDGKTLLYSTATPFCINPYIYQTLPYDPDNGFDTIALTVQVPLVLAVPVSLGLDRLEDLIVYLKQNEKASSYSSYGVGTSSHISNAIFCKLIGAPNVLHVPYKDAKAMPDLAAGRNTFQVDAWTTVAPMVASGKLKILGVCGNERLPWAARVPTVTSVIGKDYDMSTWHAVFAPKGTPEAALDALNLDIKTTMAKESVQASARSQGFITYPYKTRAETIAFIQEDKKRWKGLVEMAGIDPM